MSASGLGSRSINFRPFHYQPSYPRQRHRPRHGMPIPSFVAYLSFPISSFFYFFNILFLRLSLSRPPRSSFYDGIFALQGVFTWMRCSCLWTNGRLAAAVLTEKRTFMFSMYHIGIDFRGSNRRLGITKFHKKTLGGDQDRKKVGNIRIFVLLCICICLSLTWIRDVEGYCASGVVGGSMGFVWTLFFHAAFYLRLHGI